MISPRLGKQRLQARPPAERHGVVNRDVPAGDLYRAPPGGPAEGAAALGCAAARQVGGQLGQFADGAGGQRDLKALVQFSHGEPAVARRDAEDVDGQLPIGM